MPIEKARPLPRKTRFSIFDFNQIQKALSAVWIFIINFLKFPNQELDNLFLGSVKVRRLVADNQSP
jgi:hypothetical protein